MSDSKGLSRRDLLSMFRRSFDAAREPAPSVQALPAPLRPPGAGLEDLIADSCVRCGACVDACPRQAIKALPAAYGAWAGTPYIVPREAPCVLCTGLLCTTVCPSGTLQPVTAPGDVRMGMAAVDQRRCLPWRGARQCNVCHSRCPIPDAIVVDEQGRPYVTSACTGCGICENVCPTEPQSIRVRPRDALA